LRGDGGDIGDHRKKRMKKESWWSIKFGLSPQYDRFMRIEDGKGELLEMLSETSPSLCVPSLRDIRMRPS
jgi:hypothetical protein